MSKLCPKCNQTLDESYFAVRSNGKLQAYCRECKKVIDREYQKSKRDKKSEVIEIQGKEISEDIQINEPPQILPGYILPKISEVVNVGEWIPISERLPDKSDLYLVTMTGTNTFEQVKRGIKVPVVNIATFLGNQFLSDSVTAWQELPTPYLSVMPTVEPAPWYKRFRTGRTDKNGKMIHEGDTIRWTDWKGDTKDYLIKWRDDDFHLEFIAEQVQSSMYSCMPREWINAEIVGGGSD